MSDEWFDEDEERRALAPKPQNLDDFLRDTFGTTQSGEKAGAPPLDELKRLFKTKSAVIRHLYEHYQMSVKDIAAHTGIRYQMVRNVLTTPLKRGPNEQWDPSMQPMLRTTKKDEEQD